MLMRILSRWPTGMRRPVAAWGVATLICEAAVTWMVTFHAGLSEGVRTALVLASRLALLGFLVAVVRMLTGIDELQKRIALESVCIAFVGSLALVFVFTGLGEAAVWFPPWNMTAAAMMALWAGAYVYSSRKYR